MRAGAGRIMLLPSRALVGIIVTEFETAILTLTAIEVFGGEIGKPGEVGYSRKERKRESFDLNPKEIG
jgi:hypothetical protein